MFDWLSFLQQRGIQYVTRGKNVAKGNINVQCPFCGQADPSEHMGISLSGEGWSCWRNDEHRGKAPQRLIMALLRCSRNEADIIVGVRSRELDSDAQFGQTVSAMMNPDQGQQEEAGDVQFTPDMLPLVDRGHGRLFIDYLVRRSYTRPEAVELAKLYGLRYAMRGPFRYRVIVPVTENGVLVNWTGRAINSNAELRYRTLSTDVEKAQKAGLPVAALSTNKALWNFDELKASKGKVLVVCEGPFDALRVDFLGHAQGIRATCIFGLGNLTVAQVQRLEQLIGNYQRRVLLLDNAASMNAISMMAKLEHLGFQLKFLPNGIADPAEFTKEALLKFF